MLKGDQRTPRVGQGVEWTRLSGWSVLPESAKTAARRPGVFSGRSMMEEKEAYGSLGL